MGVRKIRQPLLLAGGRRYTDEQLDSLLDQLKVRRTIASTGTIDLSGGTAVDAGFQWPDSVDNQDVFLAVGRVGGQEVVQPISGYQYDDMTDASVGDTLEAANSLRLNRGDTGTGIGFIGKTADDDVLLQGGGAMSEFTLYRLI